MGRRIVLVAAAAVLVACGSPSAPGSPQAQGSSSSTPVPPAEGAWLAYTRTGGFAGVDDQVTVTADGAVTASTKGRGVRRFQLSPDETARLHTLADAVDVAAHPAAAPTRPGTADAFAVRLRVGGRPVAVPEGRVPADVAPLLAELQRLAQRA